MPKYNIGDTMWQIKDNKCVSFKVTGVELGVSSLSENAWCYSVAQIYESVLNNGFSKINHFYQSENFFFPSKEALLQHLSEE